MKSVSEKESRKIQNTHFVFHSVLCENRVVCETMWENIVKQGRPQLTIWRMRIARWIPKATDTYPQYLLSYLIAYLLLNNLVTCLLNYLINYLLAYLFITYLLAYLLSYLLIYLLTCLLTYLITYLLTYCMVQSPS